MKYRADIDGLRTLAILPVLFFHSGIRGFDGGFVGVDIFFVISGYLITTIIHQEQRNRNFSIVRFYERRARRILPALFFYMLLSAIVASFLFLPSYLADFGRSVFSTSLFVSNIYFWKYSGYFDSSAQLRPLLHTWSLSVEEQFYIFMPLAMWLVSRRLDRAQILFFGVVATVSLALSIAAMRFGPTANFFLLPTRSWELLLGSLLAIAAPRAPAKPIANLLGLSGMAALAFGIFTYTESTPFPGVAAIPPCLGAALLIYSGSNPASWMRQLLSTGPLVFIGKISYSLYLAHWPVAVFFRYQTLREPGFVDAIGIVVISVALALFSWRFVEQPMRDGTVAKSRARIFQFSLAGLVSFAMIGAAMVSFRGFPQRFPAYAEKGEGASAQEAQSVWRNGKCFFENGVGYEDWNAERCIMEGRAKTPVLLWGDSYAAHYVPGLDATRDERDYSIYQYTFAGCPPVLSYYSFARPQCQSFNQNVLAIIERLGIKHVVLASRWIDLRYRGLDLLKETVQRLQSMGVQVSVIGQSPIFITDVHVIDFKTSSKDSPIGVWHSIVGDSFNEALHKAAGDVRFIDPLAALCKVSECPFKLDSQLLYTDAGHFSLTGSVRAVRNFFPKTLSTLEGRD